MYVKLIEPALWLLAGLTVSGFLAHAAWRFRARRHGREDVLSPRTPLLRAALAGVAALIVIPAFGFVPQGHRGVVYSVFGGVQMGERGEGVTFLVPWVQHLNLFSVRTQKVYDEKVFAQSLDLQEITAQVSVNYRVDPERAAELFQRVGYAYRVVLIKPALFQRAKAAIGQIRAEDFAQRREELALTVQRQLTEQLAPYGILVEFVNVEDAIFDPAFVTAVKEKVIAEQEAQEQVRLIEAKAAIKTQTIILAQAKAKAIWIEAQAQANANVVLARSLTPPLLRWRWLTGWNGKVPTTLVGGKDVTLLINGMP